MTYDGVSWRVIGIPQYATVRSLAIDDETGKVYIGGVGEIGYLQADEKGTLQYVSLMDQLKENERNFSDVWRTVATKEGIYFRPSGMLLRWDASRQQMKIWKPSTRFLSSFLVNGRLYIHQEKMGVMHLVNDSLELFLGDQIFAAANKRIFMMVPYDTNTGIKTLLIGTRLKGFYLYDGKTVKPFPTEVDGYLRENDAYHGIRLSSGDFALATLRGGLVIIDPYGRLKYFFNKSSGLQDDNLKYVFEDIQGNLWLCLDNGISSIEYKSPLFIYDNRSGLSGIILSMVKQNNDVYVGTTQGLYELRTGSKTFYPVPYIYGDCWSLLSLKDSILASTDNGVFQVDNKNNIKREVIKGNPFDLMQSQQYSGRIWCGTREGLVVLNKKNSQWVDECRFENLKQPIRFMAEDKNGNLWMVTLTGDVLKADFTVDISHPVVTRYDTLHGLPGGRVYVAVAAGHVMFATGKGIFRFDEKKNVFMPDLTLGSEYAGGPKSQAVFRLVEDKSKNIWFHSESRNYQAIPEINGSYMIYSQPFRRIPAAQVNTIYPDPDGKNVWFAGTDGLIRYDTTIKKNYRQRFRTLIRKVSVNEKLIFNGYRNKDIKTSEVSSPILEYKGRNLKFEFAAPLFEAETGIRYQYFLEGYDDQWSNWIANTQKYYTNLDSGGYTFRVRAKSVYGNLGREDAFKFIILAPWYKTWWAFLLYGLVFFLLMFLLVRWRSKRLEHEKQKLERTVKVRTEEIREKNQQLEQQTLQLKEQSCKLKELDEIKSRFFANISHEFRTPLALIMAPLEHMLTNSREKEQQKELHIMLQNSQRLLTLINQLLDLSRLDSGKMRLQASRQDIIAFLEGILTTFNVLAQHNQLDLEFYSKEEGILLYFDTEKMEDVMSNLLINAIKFTPAGGEINVSAAVTREKREDGSLSPGFVEISVADTGIGIPDDQLLHIFDRFYQAEHSISGDKVYTGTGIGLALTKELVELHHGNIQARSTEGKGTRFIIRLPLGKEHLEPQEILITSEVPAKHRKADEISAAYMMEEDVEPDSTDDGEIPGTEPGSKTEPREKHIILVVDDNSIFRKYLGRRLKPLYTVLSAADGKDGINKARERIPDLIISDVMMPGIDGYELCKVLKKDIKTSHIPIILLTAKATEDSIIHGLGTGADDYITKPYSTNILIARIKNLIEQRRQMQLKLQEHKTPLPAEIPVSSLDAAFFKEFQEIIKQNIANPDFNEDVLCQKLHMSQPTLLRKIQALTDESPNRYIQAYRLKRAAELLKTNFGSVAEVAFAVGFSNTAHFARCFKEKFHQLPTFFLDPGLPEKSSASAGKTEES